MYTKESVLMGLVQTQQDHIETLLKIIRVVKNQLDLASYDKLSKEEIKELNEELVEFLNLVLKEE
jgi:hypothetical protein|nr:MAG TPA: hypothetical protein [Caudoviricetes sp.]